jgi:hypothetical protein
MDKVKSEMFSHAGFSEETGAYLTFGNGTTYVYPTIPKDTYEALRAAESMGKYFIKNIRGQHTGAKVSTDMASSSGAPPGAATPPAVTPEATLVLKTAALALILTCSALWVGCGKSLPPVPKPSAITTGAATLSDWRITGTASATTVPVIVEEPWAAALRVKAAKMGLRWKVFCSPLEDNRYVSVAEHLDAPESAQYAEDGAKDQWIESGRTRELAGRALLKALNRPAPYLVQHRQQETAKEKKHCLREVSGGYQHGDHLATDCKDCTDDNE